MAGEVGVLCSTAGSAVSAGCAVLVGSAVVVGRAAVAVGGWLVGAEAKFPAPGVGAGLLVPKNEPALQAVRNSASSASRKWQDRAFICLRFLPGILPR